MALCASAWRLRRHLANLRRAQRRTGVKKVMVVTGGSRGIGAATARLGAAHGYAVCINYLRNEAAAHALVEEIKRAGGEAMAVAGDVGNAADVARLFAEVDRKLGPVTALVNNEI